MISDKFRKFLNSTSESRMSLREAKRICERAGYTVDSKIRSKDFLSESSGMVLVADKLKKIITDPDYIVFTDNGSYDLEKKGLTGYYVWVGYVHARRSDPKRLRAIQNKLDDIAEALADIANGNADDVVIDDFTKSTDMYRLYITN